MDARQLQAERVQYGLYRRMARRFRIDLRSLQCLPSLLVAKIWPVEHRLQSVKSDTHKALRTDGAQLSAAGLDPEASLVGSGGGVALAKNHIVVRRLAEGTGKGDELR